MLYNIILFIFFLNLAHYHNVHVYFYFVDGLISKGS